MNNADFLKSKLSTENTKLISIIDSLDGNKLSLLKRYYLKIKKANDNGDVAIKQITK